MNFHSDIINIILRNNFNSDAIYAYINLRQINKQWKRMIDCIIQEEIFYNVPNAVYNNNFIKWFILLNFVKNRLSINLSNLKRRNLDMNDICLFPNEYISIEMADKINLAIHEYIVNPVDDLFANCYRFLTEPLIICKCYWCTNICIKTHRTNICFLIEDKIVDVYYRKEKFMNMIHLLQN